MDTLILGATRGLGKCIAEECRRRGWATIEVGSSCTEKHTDSRIILRADLANETDVVGPGGLMDHLSHRNIKRFFWVAAQFYKGSFAGQTSVHVQQLIDVNLRNPMLIAHWVWQRLQKAIEPASFTVIASTTGIRPRSDEAVYAATKFAQVGFTRSLGLENKNPNLKVSLFLPGGMNTEMRKSFAPGQNMNLLDPSQVASYMVTSVENQTELFFEKLIERGSL